VSEILTDPFYISRGGRLRSIGGTTQPACAASVGTTINAFQTTAHRLGHHLLAPPGHPLYLFPRVYLLAQSGLSADVTIELPSILPLLLNSRLGRYYRPQTHTEPLGPCACCLLLVVVVLHLRRRNQHVYLRNAKEHVA
jgi:hypothetical protein